MGSRAHSGCGQRAITGDAGGDIEELAQRAQDQTLRLVSEPWSEAPRSDAPATAVQKKEPWGTQGSSALAKVFGDRTRRAEDASA